MVFCGLEEVPKTYGKAEEQDGVCKHSSGSSVQALKMSKTRLNDGFCLIMISFQREKQFKTHKGPWFRGFHILFREGNDELGMV